MTESSNSTIPWIPPPCNPENWSNGSALAVLVALAIGCLAHPRGSLTFNKSGRIWRLSPHLGFIETLHLVSKLLTGLMRSYSLRVVCVTLLAVREGNSWTTTDYDLYQEGWRERQTKKKEKVLDGNQISGNSVEMGAILDTEKQWAVDEDVIPSVGRSATIEAEEGKANLNLYRRANRVAGEHDDDENTLEDRNSTENAVQAFLDTVFLFQLKETRRYEKGLIFRLLVWIPMLLALLKILSVTGGGSIWGPKVCSWMFFCLWLVTELITIIASRHQLSDEEREKALKLGRLWRKSWETRCTKKMLEEELFGRQGQESEKRRDLASEYYALKEEMATFERALIDPRYFFMFWELKGPFLLGRICCTILLGFNARPLVAKTASAYFSAYWRYYQWVDSFLWQPDWSPLKKTLTSGIEIFVLYCVVILPFFLYIVAYLGFVYSVVSPWALHILNLLLAFLSLRCGIPERILLRVVGAIKLYDLDSVVPGYLALGQVILTILRFTRVLNDYASYDCSTTTQASWYDWTL